VSVKVIRGTEIRGCAFGRNRLLELASADYVHFHNGDDFFLPGWLPRVRQAIKDCAPDAIFTEAASYRDGEPGSWRIGLKKLEVTQDLLSFCLENAMVCGAGTFSRKLLMDTGGYLETFWYSEDYEFNVRVAIRCSNYALITEPLVGIRVRAHGLGVGMWSTRQRCPPASSPQPHCGSIHIELDRYVLKGLKLLAPEIPASHQTQLADTIIGVSRRLYQRGDMEGAREGFSWASSLGQASYRSQPPAYRLCATIVGPLCAEMISTIYRKLPRWIREAVR
jgi:hypothetical protein